MIRRRQLAVLTALGTLSLWGAASCSSSDAPGGTTATGGAGGSRVAAGGTGGTGGSGMTTGGTLGVAGSSGGPSAGGTSGGAGGVPTAGSGGSGGLSLAGSSGMVGLGGGMHTPPTCAKNTPEPNSALNRAGECDFLLQSLDFEDSLSYPTTPAQIKITSFGQAFGLAAINSCSPYCFSKNLTVGIDIVGGSSAQTQGEIIIEFPATGEGLPITAADMSRDSLAWLTFDGANKPPFEIDTQMVIETSAPAIIPAVEVKAFFKPGGTKNPFGPFSIAGDYSYANGSEFKYFKVARPEGFPTAPTNVTGMGFRIMAKATAGQEWHGVAYIDHLQIRSNTAKKDPPGTYPYGLN